MKHFGFCIAAAMALGLAALTAQPQPASAMSGFYDSDPDPKNCENEDGALDNADFVIVMSPRAGDRVHTGFAVNGCSRTYESNVQWKLVGKDGSELASGNTAGGGVDGSATFDFNVAYEVKERQIGHLEVMGEDASDGEGNPPGRTVIPLVLQTPEAE
ncbi:Immunoglobulin-like domain of bacterial spore germination [Methyloligella halotolerans]|uniref:Immunoglobulin-like domain of bacterial spore germination n=2 Tax=Methyloligella halotolerans TaxID=1177755 RepID=A0A1E2S2R2_9HYPH|nr:Immunoglobulin-like domain of bacterial spore germination [Methyloligella halotolerans]